MNKLELSIKTSDPKILDELSRDENWLVRSWVAENLNTTPEILDYLSKDEDSGVRYWVAINLNTSPETLDYLSRDEDYDVRWEVARNLNTSPETLKQMAIDEEGYSIKDSIKDNPNCPLETWKYLSALEILETLSEVST